MRPLKDDYDYEPRGELPRKDRKILNRKARQQARREIEQELEIDPDEVRAAVELALSDAEIRRDIDECRDEVRRIERQAAYRGVSPLQIVAEEREEKREEERRLYQEHLDSMHPADDWDPDWDLWDLTAGDGLDDY